MNPKPLTYHPHEDSILCRHCDHAALDHLWRCEVCWRRLATVEEPCGHCAAGGATNAAPRPLLCCPETPRATLPAVYEPRTIEDVEVEHIKASIRHHQGNLSRAAVTLGIDRRTLHRKIERYRIERPRGEGAE